PRPIGSAAHAAVRDYIVAEVERFGLTADIQRRPLGAYREQPRWASPDDLLHNIAVRLPGNGSGKALVVASHYDSAPESFGAGDDGAAVASMLHLLAEAARADFANDLIFLFTDAEENCLCGAQAFMREHPWAKDVGAVLNFEARGTSGKSVMFEATPGYGALVRLYAANARSPATSSLYQSVYELLPNDTDLTVFREHGVRGLNMAFIDSSENYHTANDNFANLDRDTALHQLANMRAMLFALANADLDALEAPDAVFFDMFGLLVFVYDYAVAWLGMAAAAVLCGWLLFGAWREGRMNIARFAAACILLPLIAAVVILAMSAVSDVLVARIGAMTALGKKFYSGFFIVGAIAAFIMLANILQRRLGRGALVAAILCIWFVLLAATSIALPKVSYIFLWPLLFVLAAKALAADWRMTERSAAVLEMLAYVPLVAIWAQVAFALLLALNVADMHITLMPMMLAAALLWTSEPATAQAPR
ncbi:MAG: M28 family peptidase, partial [Gammaproteobacteria bacterium]